MESDIQPRAEMKIVEILRKNACNCYDFVQRNAETIVADTDVSQLDCNFDVHVDHTFKEKAKFCEAPGTEEGCSKKLSKDTCISTSGCVWRDRLVKGKCYRDVCKSVGNVENVIPCNKCEICETNSNGKPDCVFDIEKLKPGKEKCDDDNPDTAGDMCLRERHSRRANCTGVDIRTIIEEKIQTTSKSKSSDGVALQYGPCDIRRARWECSLLEQEDVETLRGTYYKSDQGCDLRDERDIEQQVRYVMDGNCTNVILESTVQYFSGVCEEPDEDGIRYARRAICTKTSYLDYVQSVSVNYKAPGSSAMLSTFLCTTFLFFFLTA